MSWWVWIILAISLLAVVILWRGSKSANAMIEVSNLEESATIYMGQGRNVEAEELLRQALNVAEENLSEANTAPVLLNLARAVGGQGRMEEAETYAKQALEIFKRDYGPSNTWVLASLKLLSEASNYRGKHTEAEMYLDEAAEILKKEETHPELGNPEMREDLRKAIEKARTPNKSQ